jgi:hypothetical protein
MRTSWKIPKPDDLLVDVVRAERIYDLELGLCNVCSRFLDSECQAASATEWRRSNLG